MHCASSWHLLYLEVFCALPCPALPCPLPPAICQVPQQLRSVPGLPLMPILRSKMLVAPFPLACRLGNSDTSQSLRGYTEPRVPSYFYAMIIESPDHLSNQQHIGPAV